MMNFILRGAALLLLLPAPTKAATPAPCSDIQVKVATTPVPEQSPKRYARAMVLSKAESDDVDLVIAGDSIAAHWGKYQKRDFPGRTAHNFGVGGDKTQELLWRVQNMAPDISPRNIVLIIGTNNMRDQSATACGIVAGIVASAEALAGKWPSANVFIMPILPRGKDFKFRDQVRREINYSLAQAVANKSGFSFLAIDEDKLTCNSTWPCRNYRGDALHLTSSGYRVLQSIANNAIANQHGK